MKQFAEDIGGSLRQAREQRGLTVRDLAGRTKLSVIVLQAIERNDFGVLPGGLFRKAYVRMLAGELGLDANALAREYAARFEPDISEPPPCRQGRFAALRDRYLAGRHPPRWLAGRGRTSGT